MLTPIASILGHDYFTRGNDKGHRNITSSFGKSRIVIDSLNLGDIYGPDKVYLDCGASTGIESVSYVKDFGEIHSFEPGEDYVCLRENLKHHDNIITHRLALSDENATASLVVYKGNGRTNHLDFVPPVVNEDRKPIGSTTVVTRTLDSFNFVNVSYIKIDVEGCEYNLLQGAKELLSNNDPVIKIEISNRHNEVVALLLTLDYSVIGYAMDKYVYPLSEELVFFTSPDHSDDVFWKSGDFILSEFKDNHPREFQRYSEIPPAEIPPYNPNWGDFYFKKLNA